MTSMVPLNALNHKVSNMQWCQKHVRVMKIIVC